MTKLNHDVNSNLRFGDFSVFLEIVVDNYISIEEINCLREPFRRNLRAEFGQETERNIFESNSFAELQTLDEKREKIAIQGIIITVALYEALINEIGLVNLGQKYYKTHLDKLSLISKWDIVLKLAYNKTLNHDSQYYGHIVKTINQRNNLVHYKTKIIDFKDFQEFENKYGLESGKASQNPEIFINSVSSLNIFLSALDNIVGRNLMKYYELNKQLERISKTST